MATSYEVIYGFALSRFSDYDFLNYEDETREDILFGYMKSAQSDFLNICEYDLSDYDDAAGQYNVTLDDECIEILSLGVAYYWCSAKVMNSELFRNVLNTKDYSFFSPSTLLTSLQSLRSSLQKEYKARIIEYSYIHGDIAGLKV